MTNFSDINSKQQQHQKLHLIPPATMRAPNTTSAGRLQQQQQNRNSQSQNNNFKRNQAQQNIMNHSSGKMNTIFNTSEVWSSVEDLFWDHMKEVQNKWNTLKLNDDIWAKLIYFEQNRRLAKAYVSAPVLTVDGSTNGLDGFRIGLSGIDNTYRSLDSMGCLRSIGQGIKLKIDNQGNILIRKVGGGNQIGTGVSAAGLGQCSVWVKDWPSTISTADSKTTAATNGMVGEHCMMREIEQSDISYKLFDMRKFRLQLEKRRLNDDNVMDWRQCVSIISFVPTIDETNKRTRPNNVLEDPCWLMIINIIAIDMLKSSICDMENSTRSTTKPIKESSNLIQDHHRLLESRHSRTNNINKSNNNDSNTNGSASSARLRSSSSASILFPSTSTTTTTTSSNYRQPTTTTTTSSADSANNLLQVTNERVKKLRTTNSRYRLSPMKNGSYYRRYQSTQQLSAANNIIYTTFNSKFMNSKSSHLADNLSTSDYNSASRSTSSGGQNYNWTPRIQRQSFYPIADFGFNAQHQRLTNHPTGHRYGGARDDDKISSLHNKHSAIGKPLSSLESSNKSLSLSNFDLSQRRPIDLRSMQSSIKMNFDNFTEAENSYVDNHQVDEKEHEEEEEEEEDDDDAEEKSVVSNEKVPLHNERLLPTGSRRINLHHKQHHSGELEHNHHHQESPSCCESVTTEKLRTNDSSFQEHVNHNECRATQGRGLTTPTTKTAPTSTTKGMDTSRERQQKVSRSSIASSGSSSSGCADNDYFMSHSSSSMTSSTASTNERELFSQPASSSGIVCSGSTSDEYDDSSRKPPSAAKSSGDQVNGGASSGNSSPTATSKSAELTVVHNDDISPKENIDSEKLSAHKIKKTGASRLHRNRGYTIQPVDYCECQLSSHDHNQCDQVDLDCDCKSVEFGCDCCCDCFTSPATMIESSSSPCECENESIYNRLPSHPSPQPPVLKPSKTTKKGNIENKKALRNGNSGSIVRVSSLTNLGDDFENISTIPMHESNNKTTSKDSKQSSGWLERRKYSKILPKFIFSSSSSSSSSSSNNNRQMNVERNKSTQRNKIKNNDKFRLNRSTQDLS